MQHAQAEILTSRPHSAPAPVCELIERVAPSTKGTLQEESNPEETQVWIYGSKGSI